MSSGVGVNSDCLSTFQDLKLKHKHKYIVYHLSKDKTEIVVEKRGEKTTNYDDFLGDLPESECRWAVYDFEFDAVDGGKRNKITFVSWSPDTAKIRDKMLYASSKDALRRALVGIAVEIQATDISEVSHETLLEKAKR